MQQEFKQVSDDQPATTILGEEADVSAATQAQQDALLRDQQELEEEEAAKLRSRFNAAGQNPEEEDPEAKKGWGFMKSAGYGVKHSDDEIDLHYDARKGPSQKQIDKAIDLAIKKGWEHLYLYDKSGKPDIKLAAAVNQRLVDRGLSNRLCCCTNPREMCGSLQEMKAMLAEKAKGRAAMVGEEKHQHEAPGHDKPEAAKPEQDAAKSEKDGAQPAQDAAQQPKQEATEQPDLAAAAAVAADVAKAAVRKVMPGMGV